MRPIFQKQGTSVETLLLAQGTNRMARSVNSALQIQFRNPNFETRCSLGALLLLSRYGIHNLSDFSKATTSKATEMNLDRSKLTLREIRNSLKKLGGALL